MKTILDHFNGIYEFISSKCPGLQKKTVVVDATHKVYAMSFERTLADTLHIAMHSLKKSKFEQIT